MPTPVSSTAIPEAVLRCFWDTDTSTLAWPHSRIFMMGRILRSGQWDAVRWLLQQVSRSDVASWLRAHRGGGLAPQRLRYWQLVLDLPAAEVDAWIGRTGAGGWTTRAHR